MKLAKGESASQLSKVVQCEQDTYEMQVRAANMVRAGESLVKLVSDIKQYLVSSMRQKSSFYEIFLCRF